MHHEFTAIRAEQEVLGPAPNSVNDMPREQFVQIGRHRPAQIRLAHHHRLHATTGNMRRQTAAGRFNLRQFRHHGRSRLWDLALHRNG